MSKLVPIILFSLLMALVADYFSVVRTDKFQNYYYVYKNKFYVFILALAMSIFVGLRTNYNDTSVYIDTYNQAGNTGSLINGINWFKLGENPGYSFVIRLLKHFNVSVQSYLMIYAVLTICIYIWFIRKYSDSFWLSIFLFITMGSYTFAFAALKQAFAIALCLIATDRLIREKFVPFVLWIILASFFHAYALIYILALFLSFKPWTLKTFYLLIGAAVIGVSLQFLLGSVVNITTMLGDEYNIQSFTGEGVNIFRVMVVWAPVLLSVFARKNIQIRNDRKVNIVVNLSMLNAMIMFIGLFGTANYFARLANYFQIFQTITLPLLLNAFDKRSRQILILIIIICYGAYFYYAMGVMYGGFDNEFRSISFISYLKSLY